MSVGPSSSGLRLAGRASAAPLGRRLINRWFGPNAGQRQGEFVPGTRPHPMKYYGLLDKKPNQAYGLQGANHLMPAKGSVALRKPVRMHLQKDKMYVWCNCGFSNRQPLCDGTHSREGVSTSLKPVRFIPDKDMTVWFCGCKQSGSRPFCDGSHNRLPKAKLYTADDVKGRFKD